MMVWLNNIKISNMQTLTVPRQRGISLVELLVAMAIGLFLMGGLISVFIGTKKSFTTQGGISQMQQSARFALDILTSEIRMAGFMGCYSNGTDFYNALNNLPVELDIAVPVEGYESTGPTSWAPALPAAIGGTAFGGADVITIRRAADSGARLATEMLASSATVEITANLDPEPFQANDILLISDCTRATVFQATGYANGTGVVSHVSGAGSPGNATPNLTSDSSGFATDAKVFKLESRTFFIADGLGLNNANNNYQSLWVKIGFDAPIELVPGIEDLQILFGEDTGTDGVPDRFVTANQVSDFANVLSAKVRVVANSVDPVGETGDRILRQPFESSVQLRNRGL